MYTLIGYTFGRLIKDVLKNERAKRGIPIEVKKIGGNYFAYKSTTVWDKEKKKRKKVSVYIGRIIENGIDQGSSRSIFEYGNARLVWEILEEVMPYLKMSFPDDYNEIMAMAAVRVIHHVPIRLMKSSWEKLYVSQKVDASLSPNTVSEKLKRIGSDYTAQAEFFMRLMKDSKYLIFDLSSIFSRSENLNMAEKGYNKDDLYLKQVNFLLMFSHDRKVPVMIRALPGSVRDVKAIKDVMDEYDLKGCTLIMDRGLASIELARELNSNGIAFVFPLRRNSLMIDYSMKLELSFMYRDRGINCGRKKVEEGIFLYIYEDTKLRYEEETNFISMVENKEKRRDELEQERIKFGKISLLSNIDSDPKRVYGLWKEREKVEQAFDAMKNELENDKSYLSDYDAVRGYFFVSFISLYVYFRILEIIREKRLTGKVSVNEVLFELSKVYTINSKKLSTVPAGVIRLVNELGLNGLIP